MTLGEQICALRARHGLSQGDLAERLDVSRQSVSKWETNASVPELDKLVKLSQTFGVSLDELVHGQADPRPPEPEPPSEAVPSPGAKGVPAWKVGGTLFLCAGGLLILLLTLLGSFEAGLILALPFLLCAAVCLILRRRHVTLVCCWVLWFLAAFYLKYATGIRPWWVLSPWLYRPGMEIHVLIAWAEALTLAGLIAAAALALWPKKKRQTP